MRSFAKVSPKSVTWGFVAIGLALRLWHFIANHTIWYDEAVLLANILDKSYAGLLGPLQYEVAAPPIFLWALKLIADVCGNQPVCWRFLPFTFSCATLVLTVPLVRKVLSPWVGAIAVALTAISDNHVWLGCNIKPYASDAFFSTALVYFYLATQHWSITKRLAVLALAIPPILCTSYPSVFVIGGVLLALLPYAARERFRGLTMWAAAALTALVTFAILYYGPIHNQKVPVLVNEWERYYPGLHNGLVLPWKLTFDTATIFQFCYNPEGLYFFLIAPFGIISAWRNGRQDLVVLLIAPFLLTLAAANQRAYPFGFTRLTFFLAPMILLIGGLGLETAFRYFTSKKLHVITGALLILAATVVPIGHLFKPWPRPDSRSTAAYISSHRADGDRVSSDEKTYAYFFHGELQTLHEAAASTPLGTRVWVPMDFHAPEVRLAYIVQRLKPDQFELLQETQFNAASAFLFVKRKSLTDK